MGFLGISDYFKNLIRPAKNEYLNGASGYTQGLGLRTIPTPPIIRGVPGNKVLTAQGVDSFIEQYPKKIVFDLSVARPNPVQQNISGTILWLYRMFNNADGSPNTTAFVSVQIGDITADPLVWYAGNGIEGLPFNRFYITNTAQAGISAEFAYLTDSAQKPKRFF